MESKNIDTESSATFADVVANQSSTVRCVQSSYGIKIRAAQVLIAGGYRHGLCEMI